MKYRFYKIKWDAPKSQKLPTEVVLTIKDNPDFDPENEGADALSDELGFCVLSFEYEKLN